MTRIPGATTLGFPDKRLVLLPCLLDNDTFVVELVKVVVERLRAWHRS